MPGLTANEIRNLHDKAYQHGQSTREKAADDLLFYWITNWDDNFFTNGCDLTYRGEFNMIRKAGRQVMSDLKSNPVQVDFEPNDDEDDSAAEIADGMYRTDMRNNQALESVDNAATEAIVCGYGAWELYTDFKKNREGDNIQVIKRRPLLEANNQVMWDPNAKLIDKSDADYVSCLVAYSEDGYKKEVADLTGVDPDSVTPGSFSFPEHSYVFPWVVENEVYYMTRFYHRKKVKAKIYVFADIVGSEMEVREDSIDEREDELVDGGFDLVREIELEEFRVTLYIVGGSGDVLYQEVIAGDNIPVVPMYGERAFVESQEHYEGITRLAKDPQRLRNFQMSYLADIVSKSPRRKPIFLQEQIAGFEFMYELNGADNNYPYLLQNRLDGNSNALPMGAIGEMPEQSAPSALLQSFPLIEKAINDVASADLPQDITDTNLSGKALSQLQKRFDMQSYIYQHNMKYAQRRDGEIWAGMARVVYDTERRVPLTKPDGTRTTEIINQQEVDPNTLQLVTRNNIKDTTFDVYAEVGPDYSSVKEQNREELKDMIMTMQPDDPMRAIYMLTWSATMDGIAASDIRDYARKELIMMGVKKPETEEEFAMVQQAQQAAAQQAQQPDAMTIAAIAEDKKASADLADAETKRLSAQTDQFNADTKRLEATIKAQEAGMNIQYKAAQTDGQRIDNVNKVTGRDLRQRA